MPKETISFSTKSKGWNSFHDFNPDWMIGMNSSLYTWKNGDLYKHHSNSLRNEYYGTSYPSTITTIFNDAPTQSKMFKTICIEGDDTWKTEVVTDTGFAGEIEEESFKEKEGAFYGYIRRLAGDLDPSLLSMQGIGEVASVAGPNITMSTSFTTVADGDGIYILDGDTFTYIGNVFEYGGNQIEMSSMAVTPSTGDFLVTAKNSVAESYGARGGYMEVKLTNENDDGVELFIISSEIFKSYP